MIWINADDAGLHADLDRGILKCTEEGRVTSLSIVSNGRSFDQLIRHLPLDLQINVHLCFVDNENALTKADIITSRNFTFLKRGRFFLELVKHPIRGPRQVRDEATAQIEKLLRSGFKIFGMDSHQHVHFFPLITFPLLMLARHYDLSVRILTFPFFLSRKSSIALFPFVIVTRVVAKCLRVKTHISVGFEHSGHLTSENLSRYQEVQNVKELFCHPGFGTSDVQQIYGHWKYDWDTERRVLCDQR